ncbi:MAG: dimethyl sulfoxide reductase anchor subunit family protein [Xanthobacteraceae bacterium]
MHPAYSVILFTTASGAGYGLLIWLAASAAFNLVPRDPVLGFCGLGLAIALVTLGLLSSTLHLGRPERAWRALSQWRSSWLSREGVAAIATYIPIATLGFGWVFGEFVPGQIVVGAALSVPCALITVWCTGMIYASLPTIRAWNQTLVSPVYVALALATGGVLMNLLLAVFGYELRWAAIGTLLVLVLGAVLKRVYWLTIDTAPKTHTAEAATGLGRFGTVRPLDPPHTQPNFVMREMGYQVARRHAERLRRLSTALLFLLPIVAGLLSLLDLPNSIQIAIAALSALSAVAGVLTERWLFFAEAEHVVMVFYRGGSA